METENYISSVDNFFDSYYTHHKEIVLADEHAYRSDLVLFYETLSFKIDIFNAVKLETDKKISSDFNMFQFIKTDELMLSRILAQCLNPIGNHGQGEIFLKEFLRQLNIDISLNCDERISVSTEYPTDKSRLIDIVIKVGANCIIGIENKPYVGELDNQVGDYIEFLEDKSRCGYDKFYFIFLHRTGDNPYSINSDKARQLKKDGKLILMSYSRDMVELIHNFYQICESERYRNFLQDFLIFIKDKFYGVTSG